MPNKASCGFDNISTIFLKQIAPTIIKPLTLLINHVFNTGIFPERLQLAKVIPVFKKGVSKLINNYIPVDRARRSMEEELYRKLDEDGGKKMIFEKMIELRMEGT